MADVKRYDIHGWDAHPEGKWVTFEDYVAKLAEMEAEIARMREREQHYARILRVPDGGQYRADWTGPLEVLIRDRDTLQRRVTALERAGEALRIAYGQDALAQAEEEWDALVPERTAQSGDEEKGNV